MKQKKNHDHKLAFKNLARIDRFWKFTYFNLCLSLIFFALIPSFKLSHKLLQLTLISVILNQVQNFQYIQDKQDSFSK